MNRARLPVVRVRHPCADLVEFRARFARAIATQGLFAPAVRQRPVGTRVDLAIELRDGSCVRGEAIVVDAESAEDGRPGLTFRFVQIVEGSLEYEEPIPEPSAATRSTAFLAEAKPFDGLLAADAQGALLDAAIVVCEPLAGAEPEETIEVPLREDVLDTRSAMDAAKTARRADSRRVRLGIVLAVGGGVVVAALAAYFVAGSGTRRALEREIHVADERLAEGRLAGGGDAALDHLVAARSIRPGDPRVRERLRLLADKLEELAESALSRGDYAEAAVHLTAASQADPARRSVHVRLGEIARRRGTPGGDGGDARAPP